MQPGAVTLLTIFCIVITIHALITQTRAALMAVDLGSDTMKIGVGVRGTGIQIVLNEASKRKTPSAVAFHLGERFFGDNAIGILARYPEKVFTMRQLRPFLARRYGDTSRLGPCTVSYACAFKVGRVSEDLVAERNSAALYSSDGDNVDAYSAEELVAYILEHAQQLATAHAGQPITEAVITVPPFFTAGERRAILDAARIAKIPLLALINDSTAAALKYGIDIGFEHVVKSSLTAARGVATKGVSACVDAINNASQNVLMYDLGADSLKVSIVTYSVASPLDVANHARATATSTTINPSKGKFPGRMVTRSVAWSEQAGSAELDILIADRLATTFNEQVRKSSGASKDNKTSYDCRSDMRAMTRLLSASEKTKRVLSANKETPVIVESLIEGRDFRASLTRDDLESIASSIFKLSAIPIETALKDAGLSAKDISVVEVIGGGSRVPAVQDAIKKILFVDTLGFHINSDESVAMGAAMYTASISKDRYRIPEFFVSDVNVHEYLLVNENEKSQEQRQLFPRHIPLPSVRVLEFPSSSSTHLSIRDRASVESAMVTFTNTAQQVTAKQSTRVIFAMDRSGIVKVIGAEVISSSSSIADDAKDASDADRPSHTFTNVSYTWKDSSALSSLIDAPKTMARCVTRRQLWEDHDVARAKTAASRSALEAYLFKCKDRLSDESTDLKAVMRDKERVTVLKMIDDIETVLLSSEVSVEVVEQQLAPLRQIMDAVFLRAEERVNRPEVISQGRAFAARLLTEYDAYRKQYLHQSGVDAKAALDKESKETDAVALKIARLALISEEITKQIQSFEESNKDRTPFDTPVALSSTIAEALSVFDSESVSLSQAIAGKVSTKSSTTSDSKKKLTKEEQEAQDKKDKRKRQREKERAKKVKEDQKKTSAVKNSK